MSEVSDTWNASETSTATDAVYSIISSDGKTDDYCDDDFAQLKKNAEAMSTGQTLILFADLSCAESSPKNSITLPAGVSVDLNGHKITYQKNNPFGCFKTNKTNEAAGDVFLYSSAPGGALIFSGETSSSSCFFYSGSHMIIGKDRSGTVYGKETLLLSGGSVAKIGSQASLELYGVSVRASGSGDLFQNPNASDAKLTAEDCLFSLSSFTGTVFAAKKNNFTVTGTNTRFYFYDQEACLTSVANAAASCTLSLSQDCVISCQKLTTDPAFALTLSDGLLLSVPLALHTDPTEEIEGTEESMEDTEETEEISTAPSSSPFLPDGSVYARVAAVSPIDPMTGKEILYPLLYRIAKETDTCLAAFAPAGEEAVYERWKSGELPSHAFPPAFGTYYRRVTASSPITADTTYLESTLLSEEPKVGGYLSLTESITFRFLIEDDGYIRSAKIKGETWELDEAFPHRDGCFFLSLPMDPKVLTESFTLSLTLSGGESYIVPLSLQKYICVVLRTYPEDAEAIRLVKTLAAYVKEVSCYFFENGRLTCEPSAPGLAALEEILGPTYEIPKHAISESGSLPPTGGKAILSAALNLVSDPGYAFRLHPDFTGSVTLSFLGKDTVYRVENGLCNGSVFLFAEDIGISFFRSEITVTCRGEESAELDFTFTYDLDAYLRGFTDGIPPYAYALYDYVLAAEDYVKTRT